MEQEQHTLTSGAILLWTLQLPLLYSHEQYEREHRNWLQIDVVTKRNCQEEKWSEHYMLKWRGIRCKSICQILICTSHVCYLNTNLVFPFILLMAVTVRNVCLAFDRWCHHSHHWNKLDLGSHTVAYKALFSSSYSGKNVKGQVLHSSMALNKTHRTVPSSLGNLSAGSW